MKRSSLLVLLLAAACAPPPPEAAAPAADDEIPAGPPAVILFIGDGAGLPYWSAARLASSVALSVESLPVIGLVDTHSSNSRITDSGAAATAYATGVRTYNRAIGVGPDSAELTTVLELARAQGWATGLVATSSVTHATPAAFAAHVADRGMYDDIAAQFTRARPDVLLGGGRRYFQPSQRADGRDLASRLASGAVYVDDPDTFFDLDMDTVQALVGLFAEDHPGPAAARSPNLSDLTRAALAVLEQDPDGFFLMVEGSQIDWRGEQNAPIREVLAEVYDLDLAVRAALSFQERRPNTLIVVTADHDTGGLSLHGDGEGNLAAHYTTHSHTTEMVPLFAGGPGASSFGGIMDNDAVGRLLLQLVRDRGATHAPEP